MGEDIVLDVRGLGVDLPTARGTLHAVRGVDFQVRRGELLALVGESGCGKSMTALALMGLLPRGARRSAERLWFDGADLLGLSERQMSRVRGARMAMVFQEPMTSLNPSFTLENQLCETLRAHRRVTRAQARERALDLLGRVGIPEPEGRLRQYPHQLSGGQRQRVMIAMALMCAPALLIADEPTTALDVTIQVQILRLIKELQREFGTAVVLVTHDLGVVARVADRVAVMYAGAVVETAPVRALFGAPLHPYTNGLLACIPVHGRTAPGAHLQAIPGIVPSLVGPVVGCAFRNRCPRAGADCATQAPALRGVGHQVRCSVIAQAALEAAA